MAVKAFAKKDRQIAFIAPTYQQARDIAWQQLKRECLPITHALKESPPEHLQVITQDRGVSTVYLRGWESIETLRGQKFDFLVLDEVAMLRNFWTNWQEVLRPTLTDTIGGAMFTSTPRGFNHFYDLYNKQNEDSDFASFHFTTYDNPFISVTEIEKAKRELTEDRFAQEYLADFRKTEGLAIKEFDRTRHLFDKAPEARIDAILLGIDFGFTAPACILRIARDYDRTYWVMEEWYKTQQTNEQLTAKAKSLEPNSVFPDPEAPEKILQLAAAGLNVLDVKKGKGSVEAGIDLIRQLFKQNRLKIHRSCVNLIMELETLAVKENSELFEGADHAIDALRYVVSNDDYYEVSRPMTHTFATYENLNSAI